MPRRRRFALPGEVCHVISRFVAQEYFIATAEQRRAYLCTLGTHLAASDWRCFSFAIMSNHIHLGLRAGRDALASWMRPAHTRFAQWINEQRERIGAVFVRGPNIINLQVEGVARLIAYIHRNPVRAGVVASPAETEWTSHRAYLGLAYKHSWLDVELGLELGGFRHAHDLDSWVRGTDVTLEDLEAVRADPPKPAGRKRKWANPLPGVDGSAGGAYSVSLGPAPGGDRCSEARHGASPRDPDDRCGGRRRCETTWADAVARLRTSARTPKMRNPPEQEAGFLSSS